MEVGKKSCRASAIVYFAVALNVFSFVKAQCNSNGVIVTGSSGSFSSPNYPSNYPNRETCRWIITVPQGHGVQLNFQTFVLETCVIPSLCTCDHVEVRDGSDGDATQLGKFCGNNKPAPVHSSGRFMWVEFDSDLTSNERGFLATYTAVAIPVPVTSPPAITVPVTSPPAIPVPVTSPPAIPVPVTSPPAITVPVTSPPASMPPSANQLPAINLCSNPKHPSSCNDSLTPICCHDDGPSCCRKGGARCSDGKETRNYCPRPSDESSKVVCCLDDNEKPSCCLERSYCYHWFGWNISLGGCIGATVGILMGGGFTLLLFGCLCLFICKKHPELFCLPCVMCCECLDNRGCKADCCEGHSCNCCKGCDDCECGKCECGDCDCCDCGSWDCGSCDCGGCDCGGCDCGGCDFGGDCC